jgi:hypothetical protein
MEKVRKIFLTVFIMILSMTIINGQETSQEAVDETIIDETIIDEDINAEDIKVEDIDEVPDVSEVPELSGPPELSENYLTALEEATAEGHMPIDILIQNGYLKTDVDAFIYMDKTYVPLRSVVEAFGLTDVVWDDENYVASVTGYGYTMEFLLNKSEVIVNGNVQDLQSPTVLVDDRMMVPLSFISELLGFEVIWDQTYYTVGLIHPTLKVNPEYIDDRFYTYDELQNFAKLVMRESGDTSYEVHHGVASVIMNRMSHPSFGSSVDGVIFNTEWAVQFPPAHKANFDETRPNEKAVKAVKYTLRGQNSVETCIFFNTRPFKGKPIYKVVDGVYFMQDK